MSDSLLEQTSLLNKNDQSAKQPQSKKCKYFGVVALLLLLSGIIAYYATNGKIINNNNDIMSHNKIEAISEKPNKIIMTRENVDLNKLSPKVKLSNDDEFDIKILQLNSHILKAKLYNAKESSITKFKFNADTKEVEVSVHRDKEIFKNIDMNNINSLELNEKSRTEYFKTVKSLSKKGDYMYQFNDEIIELNKERKKDEKYQTKGYKTMLNFVQTSHVVTNLILFSVKLGSYGLTGKSSHAVRYAHSLASHFNTLQKKTNSDKYPKYFDTITKEVNEYLLNKNKLTSYDDDFTVADTGDDCPPDVDNECFVSDTCWVDDCVIQDECDNECLGLCGAGCDCWSWVCGDCDCHCLCKLHDHWCSCSWWGYLDSCCYNVWYWMEGCCA